MSLKPSLYLFYGNDHPLLYRKLDECQKSLKESIPDLQFFSFDEASPAELLDFVNSGSLFGQTFCLKVSKIKGKTSLSFWEKIPHVLIVSSLEEADPYVKENSSYIQKIPCIIPKPWDLTKILQKKLGAHLTPDALEYLSSNLSSLLFIEDIENQMKFYKWDKLDIEKISFLLPEEKTTDFLLGDYFFAPEKRSLFLKILDRIINQNDSLESFWGILFKKTKDFIHIKKQLEEKYSVRDIAQKLKIHPFILEKNLPVLKQYSLKTLEQLAIKILECQFFSRFYASKMDKMLLTRLFLEKNMSSFF